MAASERQQYVESLLTLYRRTPETSGRVRRADRCLAALLYHRRVPLERVELAMRLAAARRQARLPTATPLPAIRSLHYFLPVLDELSDPRLDPDYLHYLRYRLTTPQPNHTEGADSHRSP